LGTLLVVDCAFFAGTDDPAFFDANFGGAPDVLEGAGYCDATAVEELLDNVTTVPLRTLSSFLMASQKLPFAARLPFVRGGAFFLSSAAFRSCQNVPLLAGFELALLEPPRRLCSSALRWL